MIVQEYLAKFINFFRKYKLIFILLWFLIVAFIALDGISRNIYNLDIDFIFKGIYNNRLVLYIPVWGYLFFRVAKREKSKFVSFLSRYSLLIFIVILNIYGFLKILPYDGYIVYIVRLVISFFVVVSVIPFVKRILKLFEGKRVNMLGNYSNMTVIFTNTDIYICIGLIVISLLVRFLFLDRLYPTTDEYLHLVQAKNELFPATDLFNDGEYTRAYFVTWIVKQLFSKFGMAVSTARIPGVIISCITVPLSYLLLKKENKTLAVFTALFFAFSPWNIMLARTIREYVYFLLFFLILGVYVYKRVSKILEKKYMLSDIALDIFILGALSYYSFVVDTLSTAKFFLIIYAGGFIYWLVNYILDKKIPEKIQQTKTLRKIFIVCVICFVSMVLANKIFGLSFTISQIDIIPSFNLSWIGYIFFNEEYGSLILGGIFLLAGLIFSIINMKKNGERNFSAYATIVTLAVIYFFTFHFGRYYRPRYISIIIPFVLYIEAYGFLSLKNFLFEELHICKGNILILFILLVNWAYFFYSFCLGGTGYVKISQEFHEGYGLVYEEIKNKDEGYILVTTLPDAADWYWDDDILEIYLLSYTDTNLEYRLDTFTKLYDKGFFVIDSRRNTWAGNVFKYSDYITLSGNKLNFIKAVDVYMIYEWNRSSLAFVKGSDF